MGDTVGHGKKVQVTGRITGCLREEPKVGKATNFADLGRNKSRKIDR